MMTGDAENPDKFGERAITPLKRFMQVYPVLESIQYNLDTIDLHRTLSGAHVENK